MPDEKLRPGDVVRHPVTVLSGLFVLGVNTLSLGPIDAVAAVIWTNLASLSTVGAILGFTVLPQLELGRFAAAAEAAKVLALILLVAYALKLLLQFVAEASAKL